MLENRKLHRKKKITETRYKESKYMYICEQDKLKKDFAKVPLKKKPEGDRRQTSQYFKK